MIESVLLLMWFVLCYSIDEVEDLQEEDFMMQDGKIRALEHENCGLKSRVELLEGQVKTENNDVNDNTCG